MTFSEQIEQDNQDIIAAILGSPFLKEVYEGTLSKDIFDYYITQDLYFTYDYIRAAGVCSSKAADEDLPVFVDFQSNMHTILEKITGYYANSDNFNFTSAIAPAGMAYTSFLLRTAYQSPMEVGFTALYSVPLCYSFIGRKFAESSYEGHPYAHWLPHSTVAFYAESAEDFKRFLNRRSLEHPERMTAMARAARVSFYYLYYFMRDIYVKKDFFALQQEGS